ncbi:MAG: type II toxin-antitoxin system RelE/ParE family toxin [Armatimonadota bacterium]|nr:type II toxin-antitoxin system RelE/ParE family toxin [Armatimonadota bacterium]
MARIGRASLVWTRPALDSLLDITRYIQADKPSAARRFVASINGKVGRLQSFPQSGREVPEFPSAGLREVLVADYRIIYRFMKSQNTVQILAVHHGARLLDATPTAD